MSERGGEHPRTENIEDGKLKSREFLNAENLSRLFESIESKVESEGYKDDLGNPDVRSIVDRAVESFLQSNGAEGEFEHRGMLVQRISEIASIYLRNDVKDDIVEAGADNLNQVLDEASEEAGDDKKEDDFEKEKNEKAASIAEVFSPTEITQLRVRVIGVFQSRLDDLNEAAGGGHDFSGARAETAKKSVQSIVEALLEDQLRVHGIDKGDPRYDEAIEFLREMANEAIDDPAGWNRKKDRAGEERTGPERLAGFVDEMEQRHKEGFYADAEDDEAGDEAKDSGDDDSPSRNAKRPAKMTEAEKSALLDVRSEKMEELERNMARLADLIALSMKKGGKFSPEDQARLADAYRAFNESSIAYNRVQIELDIQELGLADELRDIDRDARESLLRDRATEYILEIQQSLRKAIQEAYLSNLWRKGVANVAELWNHEDWKKKWASRLLIGGGVGALVLIPGGLTAGGTTLLGVMAKGAAMGVARGGLIGGLSNFLSNSSKKPGVDAEGDFDFSKLDKDAFAQELDDTLKKVASAHEGAVLHEANEVKAASKDRNIKKGMAWGAFTGLVVGPAAGALRYAALGGQMPHPIRAISDWADRRGNVPSTRTTVSDTPTPRGPTPAPEATPSGNGNMTPGAESTSPGGGSNGAESHGPRGGREGGRGSTGFDLENNRGGGGNEQGGGSEANAAEYAEGAEAIESNPRIRLREGPFSVFDRMGIPRSQWDSLYRNEELINELKSHGDAYSLTEQGHGFGWAHTGPMHHDSVEAIYRHAGMLNRGNFDLAA